VLRSIGKMLQVAGLVVPPLAILAQLAAGVSVGQMLLFLVAAVSAFWLGRILEGYAAG